MSYCIEFEEVSKGFGELSLFNQFNLRVPQECTTALVGESGSGKSTLLQLVNGLIQPEAGAVRVLGEDINYENLPQLRRQMGYAVQGAGLFPHLTVAENVTLVARLAGWSDDERTERLEFLLQLLDLTLDMAERYPNSLSGGQQQRVGLCRAMMLNPQLMLLDEPFSALDAITRSSIHDEFLKLQAAESRSIVLVTHDISEAIKLAHHLIILREGQVVAEGSVQVVRQSTEPYVQTLFERGLADAEV